MRSATKIALVWEGWTGETTSATYDIFRATSLAGPFTTIATGVTGTTWMDSHLMQGTPYFYKVTMTTTFGTSPASETVSATPQPFSSRATLEASADVFVQEGGSANANSGTATTLDVKNATTADPCRKGTSVSILPGRTCTPRRTLHSGSQLQVPGMKRRHGRSTD